MAWQILWTLFADYFGVSVDGCEPEALDDKPRLSLAEWSRDKRGVWDGIVSRYGAGSVESFQGHKFAQMDGLISRPTPGAQFVASVARARRFGRCECEDLYQGWVNAFRSYENAGVLPGRDAYIK
ncbi:hypothetical protein BDW74DRAFT_158340 [Aspergillus multicolor]|uniref:uncharacterized protein n=1 Tax=Aspergillus multicolor TaxID=41759 RepID=UPI003CCD9DF8